MNNIGDIKGVARDLGLYNISSGKVNISNIAKQGLNNLDFLLNVLMEEVSVRNEKRIKKAKEISGLPTSKFKKNMLSDVQLQKVNRLETLEFLLTYKNIIISGECCTGKTSLASSIGNIAIENGKKVIYVKQEKFLGIVKDKRNTSNESKAFKQLKSAQIIIIDDFLYSRVDEEDIDLLYKALMFFNECRSLILITNRDLYVPDEISYDKHIVKTMIDRLMGNSSMLILNKKIKEKKTGTLINL